MVHVAIAAPTGTGCARIEALLAAETDLCVVGSGASTALAELLNRTNPDVLVLDPGSEPVEVLERVAGVEVPATVLLSREGHPERYLLGRGVRAVLRGRTRAASLVAAVRAVAAGLVVLDADHAGIEPLSGAEARDAGERIDALTPRETEVLQLLVEGLPNREIAGTLGISEHTVKFHLSAVFGKLGATSRTEAVAIGIRRGLVMV
jgi:NarL family two-component system response regulator YdfI